MTNTSENRNCASSDTVSQRLFESLPIGLVLVTADGYVVEANPTAHTLFGRDAVAAAYGRHLSHLVPQWAGLDADALPAEAIVDFAHAGHTRHLRLRRTDLGSVGSGDSLCYAIVVEDVTEQEAAKRLLTATMHEPQDRQQGVKGSVEGYRPDAIKQFVATLIHDVRSPVAAALINSQLLRRSARAASVPAALDDYTRRVQINLRRLERMVEDLLDMTRYDTGEALSLDRQPTRLDELLREVAREREMVHRRIVELREPLPAVSGSWDPDGLRRVIENLINNAVKYGDKERPITLWLDDRGGQAALHVRSFGEPIPLDTQWVIFEPFYRAMAPANRRIPGWSIGLAFVRAMVEAHGGSVAVTSTAESGTVFSVYLPS